MAISTKSINNQAGSVDIISNLSKATSSKSKGINSDSDSKEKASDAFSSIMNMTAGNFDKDVSSKSSDNKADSVVSATAPAKSKNDVRSVSGSSNRDKTVAADNKNDKLSAKPNDKKADLSRDDVSKADAYKADSITSDVPDDEELSDAAAEFAAELVKLIENIKDILQDKLGISDEDIEASLDTLGLIETDLLDMNNVEKTALDAMGATVIDLITDEQVEAAIGDIDAAVNEAFESFEAFDITAEDFTDVYTMEDKQIPVEIAGDAQEAPTVSLKSVVEKADELIAREAVNASNDDENGSDISENADNIIEEFDITVESGTGTDGSAMSTSQQSQTGSGEGFTENNDLTSQSILNNLNNAINNAMTAEVEGAQGFDEGVQQADILRQVVDEIKANISSDVTTLDMRLNPESLGRVQITVSSRNGVMEARIVAETEAAKNAIEANLTTLRETLNNQELKVQDVEVVIASRDFFENENEQQELQEQGQSERDNGGSRGRGVGAGSDSTEDSQTDTNSEELLRAQGSSVSYTA